MTGACSHSDTNAVDLFDAVLTLHQNLFPCFADQCPVITCVTILDFSIQFETQYTMNAGVELVGIVLRDRDGGYYFKVPAGTRKEME